MHIVSRKRLLEFAEIHADVADRLDLWYRVAKSAEWTNLVDVRQTYPATDSVGNFTVFNIKPTFRTSTFTTHTSHEDSTV